MVEHYSLEKDLLACLHQEIELARRIVEELDSQQTALQKLDLAGLEMSLPLLEDLAGEMNRAEEQRTKAAERLSETLSIPVDAPLRDLLEVVPAPLKFGLEQARAELRALIERIHDLNNTNYALMLNAARYNRAILQHISGTGARYSRVGVSEESAPGHSVVLNKKA